MVAHTVHLNTFSSAFCEKLPTADMGMIKIIKLFQSVCRSISQLEAKRQCIPLVNFIDS